MPSGLLFQICQSVIVSLDDFPSCSRFDLAGVRGHFASWSSADRQRDSAGVDVEHLRKVFLECDTVCMLFPFPLPPFLANCSQSLFFKNHRNVNTMTYII